MQKEQFESIMDNLNKIIETCKECQDKINKAGGYGNLTVKESNILITTATSIKGKMDKIITTELYHIIGMGNLSVMQNSRFCKAIKDLTSYRYLIERLVQFHPITYNESEKSTYNCQVLGIKLEVNRR